MVFHDVTHSISVSGKVLEKADMDFFHSSNANYSCHVFKPCSRSKEYRVRSMKEDNLDIYSLPPTRFEQADSLCPTISSLPFKTHFFFNFLPLHNFLLPLLLSPYFSHPLQEVSAKIFSYFFTNMLLLSCTLPLPLRDQTVVATVSAQILCLCPLILCSFACLGSEPEILS